MLKTLKVNATAPVKTGAMYVSHTAAPTTPPLPSEMVVVSKSTLLSPMSGDAPTSPSAFEAAVGASIETVIDRVESPTMSPSDVTVTSLSPGVSPTLSPSDVAATSLAPGVKPVVDYVYVTYPLRPSTKPSIDAISSDKPTYKTALDLNGIGIEKSRPALVSLIDFEPIYQYNTLDESDASVTEAGRFLRQQYDYRRVREQVLGTMLSKLSNVFGNDAIESTNDNLSISRRREENISQIEIEKKNVKDLYNVFNTLDEFISLLDLRNPTWSKKLGPIAPAKILSYLLYNYNVDSNVEGASSSKIWAQIAFCLKEALRSNSIALQTTVSSTPVPDLTKIKTPITGLTLDSDPDLLSIDIISKVEWTDSATKSDVLSGDVSRLLEAVKKTIIKINTTSSSDQNLKTSALINALSKESNLSSKLSTPSVKGDAFSNFGYTVKDDVGGNLALLDNVFGKFGERVTKFAKSDTLNDSSIVGISQDSKTIAGFYKAEGVLVFETNFIKDGEEIISPGSEYYVEQFFRETVDTAGLFSSITNLRNKLSISRGSVQAAQNLLCFPYLKRKDLENSSEMKSLDWKGALKHPSDLIAKISNFLISLVSFPLTDDLSLFFAMMKHAAKAKDPEFKSLLFTYFMFMLTHDKCPKAIIERMVKILQENYRSELAGDVAEGIMMKDAVLVTTLLNPSPISIVGTGSAFRFFLQVLREIRDSLVSLNAFSPPDNFVTRFSNQLDTTLLLAAFDIFVQISNAVIGGEFKYYFYFPSFKNFYITAINFDASKKNLKNLFTTLSTQVETEVNTLRVSLDCLLRILDELSGFITALILPNKDRWADMLQRFSISDRQQVNLYAERVKHAETLLKYNRGTNLPLTFLDESSITDRDWYVLDKFLKSSNFGSPDLHTTDAYNKKIMSVAIPTGFVQRLRRDAINESLAKTTSGINKQYDFVYLNVYKQDGNHPDIVYKPLKFLFEISRFPVRSITSNINIKLDVSSPLYQNIPSYDFGSISSIDDLVEQSWYGDKIFSTPDYKFLSDEDKRSTVHNNVVSYLLEIYVRLTSGLMLSEQQHYDGEVICLSENHRRALARGALALISDPDLGKLSALPELGAALNSVPPELKVEADQALRLIASLTRSLSSQSDRNILAQKMRYRRKWDRVLNVIFDPDDFEIDVPKTNSTKNGAGMLSELMSSTPPKIRKDGEKYYGSKRTTKDDILHEIYYVTFESYKLTT